MLEVVTRRGPILFAARRVCQGIGVSDQDGLVHGMDRLGLTSSESQEIHDPGGLRSL